MPAILVSPIVAVLLVGVILLTRRMLRRSGRQPAEPTAATGRPGARAANLPESLGPLRLLIHSINDDRCTGCDACILVCPTDVLELRKNKSYVARFEDCIQCKQCELVCPTQALVMHGEGEEPRRLVVPDIDDYCQSNHTPGLYLVGEVAGKPLVKNGVNMGRAAVEHILRSGLSVRAAGLNVIDVIIVGSGPAGLSAALSCIQEGLSYVVLEKDALVASTIARYPKGKHVMAEPYDVRCVGLLPVWDATKDELIEEWNRLLSDVSLNIRQPEIVEHVELDGAGFVVRTDKSGYQGQRLILAIGGHGKPRRLHVPGEDSSHVRSLLDDPDHYKQCRVLVVGGGDSAVEAAVALADPSLNNQVSLSYRRKQFNRVKQKNRQALKEAEQNGRVRLLLNSEVQSFETGHTVLRYSGGKQENVPTDHALVLIGADPPVEWLRKLGIAYVERPFGYTAGSTDVLVERLTGPLTDNNRPGGRLAYAAPAEDLRATTEQDRSEEMASVYAAHLKHIARSQGAHDAGTPNLIHAPKEQFLLHPPEKAHPEGTTRSVRDLRNTLRGPSER
jgi:thioredoxin reductase/NAD-dependent dihydropyrimidine dehydrogenase PreA subunit